MSHYNEVYQKWQESPDAFWAKAAKGIDWYRSWDKIRDDLSSTSSRWFSGAVTNTCYNALDRHVERGRGDQPALIYDSAVTEKTISFSYCELRDAVAHFAGALERAGLRYGDRVIVYMPMVPETVVAILACARIGVIHSVVFGGFAAKELATRIDDAQPKLIIAASCGIEADRVIPYKPLVDKAVKLAQFKPELCIILQRPQHEATLELPRDIDWREFVEGAKPSECAKVKATDPLYILYTSGTTGVPKGVVRDNGGHMVALSWSMKNIYGINPGEVFWAASDVGWVVGHSYIIYGPLLHGATTILYEGKPVGTPDPGAFWRVISQHNVSTLFTAPTAFRAIRREDPEARHLAHYELSRFRTLFLAGERSDPETLRWAEQNLGVPVIDHWWQTETGWPVTANCAGLGFFPVKHGSPGKPVPGFDVRVLDENGEEVPNGTTGSLALRLPLPPGCLPTLWNNDVGYRDSYLSEFDGFYATADAGFIDDEGYVYVMSRTDDIINVAGHRLSTGGIEEVLASHPNVAECAVIGVADKVKGQVPLGLVVLKSGVNRPTRDIENELVELVRDRIGPVASYKISRIINRLPKTRSGKVLRATMRCIADGTPYRMPATIDDPSILSEITDSLHQIGLGIEAKEDSS